MLSKFNISIIPVLILLFLFVGMAQYLPAVIENILRGNVVIWTFSSEVLNDAGALRYIKDAFLVLFGFYWPYWCLGKKLGPKPIAFIKIYICWITVILGIGTLGFVFELSPIVFFKAGVRWLILLHASVGLFFITLKSDWKKNDNKTVFYFVFALVSIDSFVIFLQLSLMGFNGIGSQRISGLFSNAGVAGGFATATALISLIYLKIPISKKLQLLFLCLFIGVASGTRFTMICVFLCFLFAFYDFIRFKFKGSGLIAILALIIPIFIFGTLYMYTFMIDSIGRGGIIEAQLGSGGRIGHFIFYSNLILQSDFIEFCIGRGLGLGTNTGYSLIFSLGQNPESYRFNWLTDNTLLATFFQIGFLGSIIFWSGFFGFISIIFFRIKRELMKYYLLVTFIVIISIFAGNLFEQYYLITIYLFIYGVLHSKNQFSEV